MIVDSSALVAILRQEPEREDFTRQMAEAPINRLSAANFLETAIIIDANRNPVFSRRLDALLSELAVTIEDVTEAHVRIARDAYRDFGKGSGSKARLNYGDCFAYALAKATGEPLLFKGSDFVHTDVTPAD